MVDELVQYQIVTNNKQNIVCDENLENESIHCKVFNVDETWRKTKFS